MQTESQILVNQQRLTPDQAARYLGLESAGTLAVWRCTKRYPLPYVKIGRKVVYDIRDLDAFIESRKVGRVENHAG